MTKSQVKMGILHLLSKAQNTDHLQIGETLTLHGGVRLFTAMGQLPTKMKKIGMFILIVTLTVASILSGLPISSVNAAASLTVYADELHPEFQNYSWADVDLSYRDVHHSGTSAIRMNPSGEGGLYLYKDRIASVSDYPILQFWAHGGTTGGQKLRLVLNAGGQQVAEKKLNDLLPDGQLAANKWQKVSLDLKELSLPNGIFDGILLQDISGVEQSPIFFDDIVLIKGSEPVPTPSPASSPTPNPTQAPTQTTEPIPTPTPAATSQPAPTQNPAPTVQPSPTPPASSNPIPQVSGFVVYDEQVQSPFQDYGWAQHHNQSETVSTGTQAIEANLSDRASLYFYKDNGSIHTKDHDVLEFWINGGAQGGQQVELQLNSGGAGVANVDVDARIEGGIIPANEWVKVSINLPELEIENGIFDAILIRGAVDGAQQPIYLDDIHVLEKYVAPPTVLELLLSNYEMILLPGDTTKLELTANLSDASSLDVTQAATWESSNPNVVSVVYGTVTAHQAGIAKITATYSTAKASAYAQVTHVEPVQVYTDAPAEGFANWSWGTSQFDSTEQVHSGTHSIAFAARGYEGIWLHQNNQKYEVEQYYGASVWVHGGSTGGQQLKLLMFDDRSAIGEVNLPQLPANQWTQVTVKLADMGITSQTFDGIVIQAWGEQDQGYVYFDDMELLKNGNVVDLPDPELPKVSVSIDTTTGRRAVNPDIFGVNFEERPGEGSSQMKFPLKRWGGNQMSRYNWELDVTNRAGDWYFLNLTNDTPDPAQLPYGSLSDRFIQQAIQDNTKVLLQVPTIGWAPKSRDVTWSYSIDKYGAQAGDECDWGEAWCRGDAGNGFLPDGTTYMTGNDPTDTAKPVGPDFVGRWIDHLNNRFGNVVRHYALDNEPALWGHTHRDIHPEMTTYDEIWDYTVAYGSVIKNKDPQAQIYGPVPWGWCEYFYSGKDGCFPGEDMAAHDNKPFLEWYLSKAREYENLYNVRLVDVLDIHYYPAEAGITFTSDESKETSKRRLQALKSLYDPTYQDPTSWIQEPVRLLPRMREIIERNAPGTKLAITEYNFGDGNGISTGLAQAEALALFAREGVDLATRWGGMSANTPLEDAFKLYLNYDGNGSKVEGDIVQTTSSNVDAVGAYTVQAANGKTFILLFNKDTAPRTAEIAINDSLSSSAQVYRFDARQRLNFVQHVQTSGNQMSVPLPARSATLVVSP